MALIVPSFMAFDLARLEEALEWVRQAGADTVHIDVCDGHFAPGITVGVPVIESIRRVGGLRLEVHLWVEQPERFLGDFMKAGASGIALHPESTHRFCEALAEMKTHGVLAGAGLIPQTSIETLSPVLDKLDFLVLSSGGQDDDSGDRLQDTLYQLETAVEVRKRCGRHFSIKVEGVTDPEWVQSLTNAGADVIIVGTASQGNARASALLKDFMLRLPNVGGANASMGEFHP